MKTPIQQRIEDLVGIREYYVSISLEARKNANRQLDLQIQLATMDYSENKMELYKI